MKQNRFVTKWNNGAWKVFDNQEFYDIIICKLQSEAELQALKMNSMQS